MKNEGDVERRQEGLQLATKKGSKSKAYSDVYVKLDSMEVKRTCKN